MKKRIFWSILLSCFLTLLVTAAFVTSVLYVNSWEEYKREIETEVLYVGEAVNVMDASDGEASRYLEEVGRSTKNRITLIAADGSVLFDSYADEEDLDNHLSRPEIAAALADGSGQAERLSDTFGERSYYSALRLEDGSVLRIGGTAKSVLGIVGNALAWIVIVSVFVLLITVLAASLLTGTITNRSIKSTSMRRWPLPPTTNSHRSCCGWKSKTPASTSKSANCESNRRNSTI